MPCAIVASVLPRSTAELRAAAAAAARDGDADLLELRADLAGDRFAEWLALLPQLPLPVLVTIRARAHGGAFEGDERERAARLAAAARVAAWIDVEAETPLADELAGVAPFAALSPTDAPRARPIVSLHAWDAPPVDLEARALALVARHPAAIVKLAIAARDLADVERVVHLQRRLAAAGARAACFALGELGAPTRLLAGKLGAALVYGSIDGHAPTGPGQPTLATLARLHRVREQEAATPVAAVLGDPIGHSLSPRLHSALYRAAGLARCFVPLRAPELPAALSLCDALGIAAASVTLPHKEAAASLAVGAIAGEPWPPFAGSANTLLRRDAGWLAGNSDVAGFRAALAGGWPKGRAPPRRALLLGAGGVARTALAALRNDGVAVTVAARTFARAQALAAEFGATAVEWAARGRVERELIVQATPLGMAPLEAETPLPIEQLSASDVVLELIYRPRRTRLLREAEQRGAATIEGAAMFVAQALQQHRWFTGHDGDLTVAQAELAAALDARE
ncbi:MAG: type I 3-dehydroquinate dehydratase [Planctomycetes bacterium]|nr:type I 3-dehydroquinate dehydratase [Planctomycetota bacterium]